MEEVEQFDNITIEDLAEGKALLILKLAEHRPIDYDGHRSHEY